MTVRIAIEKFAPVNQEYWVNVYYAPGSQPSAAQTIADLIMQAERPLYVSTITITKAHIDDMTPDTDVFQTIVYNQGGTRTGNTTDLLPFWTTARVDFSTAGGGRPSRKYLRGVLFEQDANFMTIEATMQTRLQTYADAIVASGACDVDGQDLSLGVARPYPQMRQLRRGSKKKDTP